MNGYYRDLIKILKAHGYYFLRHGRGDHEIWFNGKTIFTVDKKGKAKPTANSALKKAGIKERV